MFFCQVCEPALKVKADPQFKQQTQHGPLPTLLKSGARAVRQDLEAQLELHTSTESLGQQFRAFCAGGNLQGIEQLRNELETDIKMGHRRLETQGRLLEGKGECDASKLPSLDATIDMIHRRACKFADANNKDCYSLLDLALMALHYDMVDLHEPKWAPRGFDSPADLRVPQMILNAGSKVRSDTAPFIALRNAVANADFPAVKLCVELSGRGATTSEFKVQGRSLSLFDFSLEQLRARSNTPERTRVVQLLHDSRFHVKNREVAFADFHFIVDLLGFASDTAALHAWQRVLERLRDLGASFSKKQWPGPGAKAAAKRGDIEAAELLSSWGVPMLDAAINVMGHSKSSDEYQAAWQFAETLTQMGATVKVPKLAYNSLLAAAARCDSQAIEQILAWGVDAGSACRSTTVDAAHSFQQLVVDWSTEKDLAKRNALQSVLQLLVNAGASLDIAPEPRSHKAQLKTGEAFLAAVQRHDMETVEIMISWGLHFPRASIAGRKGKPQHQLALAWLWAGAQAGEYSAIMDIIAQTGLDIRGLKVRWYAMPPPKPEWFVDVLVLKLIEQEDEGKRRDLQKSLMSLVGMGASVADRDSDTVSKAFHVAVARRDAESVLTIMRCGCNTSLLYQKWREQSRHWRIENPFPLHALLKDYGEEANFSRRALIKVAIDAIVQNAGTWLGSGLDYGSPTSGNPLAAAVEGALSRADANALRAMSAWGIHGADMKLKCLVNCYLGQDRWTGPKACSTSARQSSVPETSCQPEQGSD